MPFKIVIREDVADDATETVQEFDDYGEVWKAYYKLTAHGDHEYVAMFIRGEVRAEYFCI